MVSAFPHFPFRKRTFVIGLSTARFGVFSGQVESGLAQVEAVEFRCRRLQCEDSDGLLSSRASEAEPREHYGHYGK